MTKPFDQMTFDELLRPQGHDCACGMHHDCGLKYLRVGKGVVSLLPQALQAIGARRPFLVMDPNTRRAAGETVERVLREAGIEERFLVADPGLGFSKTGEQNWDLLADWDAIASHGLPVLIGASRKRFVSALDVDRDAATAAISAYSAEHGAWAVRVHEVPSNLAAVRVGDRLRRSRRR